MSNQAEPQGQSYGIRLAQVDAYTSRDDPRNNNLGSMTIYPDREGSWNDRYLSGLFRNGLMLTTHSAYMLMYDDRYPGGKPILAPRPTSDEPNLWPEDTWVIFRD